MVCDEYVINKIDKKINGTTIWIMHVQSVSDENWPILSEPIKSWHLMSTFPRSTLTTMFDKVVNNGRLPDSEIVPEIDPETRCQCQQILNQVMSHQSSGLRRWIVVNLNKLSMIYKYGYMCNYYCMQELQHAARITSRLKALEKYSWGKIIAANQRAWSSRVV